MDVSERMSSVRPHFRSDLANDRFGVIRVGLALRESLPHLPQKRN
jgi:hypothetical protein